jgi:cystine transport system substrate-binding protein
MKRIFTMLILGMATISLLAGCGANSTAKDSPSPSTVNVQSTPVATAVATPVPTITEKPAGEVMSRIKKSGILKVAFEGTYTPFNFLNDKKEYDGFDVDISNEIAKRLGVKTEFLATQWEGLIGGLKADKFDIIIAQMSITDERKKSVDFTVPYVVTGGVLITRKDTTDITKMEDLKGKKVGVGAGTTFEEAAKKIDGAVVKSYKSSNDYLQDLLNKRLDVIINDQLRMAYTIKEKSLPVQIASDIVTEDNIGMAIKLENGDFVEAVNTAISDMKKDGTYESLFMKWFGVKPSVK